MSKFIENFSEMFKEGGYYSLTRVLPSIGYTVFIFVSLYLALTGNVWANYPTFAAVTGGGGLALQGVNKVANSKWNTAPGEIGKQIY